MKFVRTFRTIVLGLALLCAPAVLRAQRIPPGNGMAIYPDAKAQIDSIVIQTLNTHTEQIACVVRSGIDDSTWVLFKLGPAQNILEQDSLRIRKVEGTDVCPWWQEVLHTHIVPGDIDLHEDRPSGLDQHTTAERGIFGLIISVHPDTTWRLIAYP